MGSAEHTRLVAWSHQMRDVHTRLLDAWAVAYDAAESHGPPPPQARELLLHCWGFCLSVSGHHRGEDTVLFPALARQHPELVPVLSRLRSDHSMLEHLLGGYREALDSQADSDELRQHLDGIGAVLQTHFRYEERVLLPLLDALPLQAEPREVFGPLAP
ncbi:hemerythrin domain-containing protein [Dermacoccaceae bacterium W4C1]